MMRFFYVGLVACLVLFSTGIASAEIIIDDSKDKAETSPKDPYLKLADNVQRYSQKFLNIPYRYGGKTPKGFDCSGFVRYCFKQFGMPLSIGSQDLSKLGYDVPPSGALAGDLIFFRRSTNPNSQVSHVGIVVEANEKYLKFVHASVGNGVAYSYLHEKYYAEHFVSVRRVMDGLKNFQYD